MKTYRINTSAIAAVLLTSLAAQAGEDDAAVTDMETYADNCVRSYFEVKVGTFKTLELYNKGAGECSYLTVRNTFPGVSDDSRIMGRFLEIVSLKGQEQERELTLDPDAGTIKALLGIDQYVSASFMEAMAKHCTYLGGKNATSEAACK